MRPSIIAQEPIGQLGKPALRRRLYSLSKHFLQCDTHYLTMNLGHGIGYGGSFCPCQLQIQP